MRMGQGTRFAVLADVHGNSDALRAVLADLDGCGEVDRLLVLGDIVLLGPDPGQVVELLMARDATGVYGNTDRFLLDADWRAFRPQGEEDEADQALCVWALDRLSERAQAWLRGLPFRRELEVDGQQVLLVHASPRSDRDVIQADTPEDNVLTMMTGVQADLLLLGHTHDPFDRSVGGVRLINPGAVGYPRGQTGTARYALVAWDGHWRVEFRLVHYEIKETIARLLAARRPYRLWIAKTLRRATHIPLDTLD